MSVPSTVTLPQKSGVSQALGRGGAFIIGSLALRDILREPLISICLVFSVVAVLTPIMLLTSVKVGFIDSLRQQFIEDPSFREIRPGSADLRPPELFERIAKWEGIEYVVPTVMMNPREVAIRARGKSGIVRASPRLLPSTPGDPLLQNLEGEPPSGDNIVLTKGLFENSGLELGDVLTLAVTRIVNDERNSVRFDLRVVGWVPTETVDIPTILADPEIEQQVEAYRAGIAVPARGWSGVNAEPKPVFRHLYIVAPDQLGATLETELRVRVGAAKVEKAMPDQVAALINAGKLDFPPTEMLLLSPGTSFYANRDVDEANRVLSNTSARAVGISPPIDAQVLGNTLSLTALPEGATLGDGRVVQPDISSRGEGYKLNDRIALPAAMREAWKAAGEPANIELFVTYPEDASTKQLGLPMRVAGFYDGKAALVSNVLLGLLNRGNQIILDFDVNGRRFIERNAGFRGFRIVGDSIDTMPLLEKRFTAEGIKVKAKSSQILKLQRLESSLNLLVLVVASVALAGGLSILMASFFANVQRKRVDYATLRLIGMPKRQIATIPIAQSVIFAGSGFSLSVIVYFLIAILLNGAVSQQLDFDGQLSNLYLSHFFYTAVVVLSGSCLASLGAARAATRIDPATALRSG